MYMYVLVAWAPTEHWKRCCKQTNKQTNQHYQRHTSNLLTKEENIHLYILPRISILTKVFLDYVSTIIKSVRKNTMTFLFYRCKKSQNIHISVIKAPLQSQCYIKASLQSPSHVIWLCLLCFLFNQRNGRMTRKGTIRLPLISNAKAAGWVFSLFYTFFHRRDLTLKKASHDNWCTGAL